MNFYDSDKIRDLLFAHGYEKTNIQDDADLIVLNTCHIREKATEKIYSELGRIKKNIKKNGNNTTIAVAGCVAQAEGKELVKRAPMIDLVFGPLTYHRLPEILQSFDNSNIKKRKTIIDIEPPINDKFNVLPKRVSDNNKNNVSALLSVQEGCDKFCTFCVVPYTRGIETSRSCEQIIDEAEQLISSGVKEIMIITSPDSIDLFKKLLGKTKIVEKLFE